MKIFTKTMLSIVLAVTAVGGAKAQDPVGDKIYEKDWTTAGSYSMWNGGFTTGEPAVAVEGKSIGINNSSLEVRNEDATTNNWDVQYFVGDGIKLTESYNYVVRITLKGSTAENENAKLTCALGDWSNTRSQEISFTTTSQTYDVTFNDFPVSATAHVMLQSGKYVGTINIEKVEVFEEAVGYNAEANHMLKVSNNGSTTDGYGKTAICTLNTPLTAGTDYIFSATMMATTDGNCKPVPSDSGSDAVQYSLGDQAVDGTFKRLNWYFKAENSFDKITLWLGSIAGDVYLEDVTLTVNGGDGTNYIDNGDFEIRIINNWSVPSWTGQAMAQVEKVETRTINVSAAGYATFYSSEVNVSLNVEGVQGYAVNLSGDKSEVTLTPQSGAPRYRAVLIEAAEGRYDLPVVKSTGWFESDLKGYYSDVVSDGEKYYALGVKGGVVGFYKVKNGETIKSGKGYLEIPTGGGSGSRDFIGFSFGGETTGIDNAQLAAGNKADGAVYNLAGQRVSKPTRGLYIVNGKKVVVK